MTVKQGSWWAIFISSLFVLAIASFYGLFPWLAAVDVTYLSIVMLATYPIASIGNLLAYNSKGATRIQRRDFYASQYTTVGLAGTIIGFMLMLSSVFVGVDVTNIEQMKEVIATMSSGMGSALVTTLTGIVVSSLLRLQLLYLDEE